MCQCFPMFSYLIKAAIRGDLSIFECHTYQFSMDISIVIPGQRSIHSKNQITIQSIPQVARL